MFLVFLFKWTIALTLLYSLYGLLLRRETFYRVNRFVLLCMFPLSAWLATIRVETQRPNVVSSIVSEVTELLAPTSGSQTELTAQAYSCSSMLSLIYGIGLSFFVLQYLLALTQVVRLIRQGHAEEDYLINDAVPSPFSWFRWIVISNQDLRENGQTLLTHERIHVSHYHSWDMLLCEICVRLQWFNPFAWMLRKNLRAVHEFEADHGVLESGCNIRNYNMLLVEKAVEANPSMVTNQLSQSELAARLKMMYRKPSARLAMLKVLYLLPLAYACTLMFAKPVTMQNIINARDVNTLVHNVRSAVDLTTADEVPHTTEAADAKQLVTEDKDASVADNSQATAPSEDVATPDASLLIDPNSQGYREYLQKKAVEAMESYINMSYDIRKGDPTFQYGIILHIDHAGHITCVEIPDFKSEHWNPAEIERKALTIPTELVRNYLENTDNPAEKSTITLRLRQYIDSR